MKHFSEVIGTDPLTQQGEALVLKLEQMLAVDAVGKEIQRRNDLGDEGDGYVENHPYPTGGLGGSALRLTEEKGDLLLNAA